MQQARLPARRRDRPGRASSDATTSYLRGRDGSAQLTVDSRGRPTSAVEPKVQPAAGQHAPADDRHRPPARGRAGAARTASELAHAERRRGRPTAARSSRSTRATARCSRSRRTRPTSRRSTSAATRAKLAPLQNAEGRDARRTSRASTARSTSPIRRARRGSRSRRSRRCRSTSSRRTRRSSARPTSRSYGQVFTTGTRTSISWIDAADRARRVVRHVLLPGRRATSTSCRRAAATRSRTGRRASASARRPGIDIGPEARRPRADAGVALRAVRRPAVHGTSTGSGSRATRSSSRSARATSTVTPIQMARFYAMIANGGQLVTPHIVAGRRAADRATRRRRRCCAASPPSRRRRAASTRPRSRSSSRASTRRRTRRSAPRPACSAVPGLDRGQDGHRREARHAAGLSERASKLDQSWWCGYGPYREADDRRLRGDRERRPRRHRGGPGGAEGVRGSTSRSTASRPRPSDVIATDGDRSGRHPQPAASRPPRRRGDAASLGVVRAARLGAARARWSALVALRALGDRRDHAPRRRRQRSRTAGAVRRGRRRRCSSSRR